MRLALSPRSAEPEGSSGPTFDLRPRPRLEPATLLRVGIALYLLWVCWQELYLLRRHLAFLTPVRRPLLGLFPLPPLELYRLLVGLEAAALCALAAGLATRPAAALALALHLVPLLGDLDSAFGHYTLECVALLALCLAGDDDERLRATLAAALAAIFTLAGLSKLARGEWWDGRFLYASFLGDPDFQGAQAWLAPAGRAALGRWAADLDALLAGGPPTTLALPAFAGLRAAAVALSWVTIGGELAIGAALAGPWRARRGAALAGVAAALAFGAAAGEREFAALLIVLLAPLALAPRLARSLLDRRRRGALALGAALLALGLLPYARGRYATNPWRDLSVGMYSTHRFCTAALLRPPDGSLRAADAYAAPEVAAFKLLGADQARALAQVAATREGRAVEARLRCALLEADGFRIREVARVEAAP